jgi:hypothetical protein
MKKRDLRLFLLPWIALTGLAVAAGAPPKQEPSAKPRLSAEELGTLWRQLRGADARTAYQAIGALIGAPEQSVPFLKKHVRPEPGIDPQHVAALIADLDSRSFAKRQSASEELDEMGETVETALREALARRPSLEVRRRIRLLLERQEERDEGVPPRDRLQLVRALEVLEGIGNAEARKVLVELAQGDTSAWLTKEAKASLQRLEKRPR